LSRSRTRPSVETGCGSSRLACSIQGTRARALPQADLFPRPIDAAAVLARKALVLKIGLLDRAVLVETGKRLPAAARKKDLRVRVEDRPHPEWASWIGSIEDVTPLPPSRCAHVRERPHLEVAEDVVALAVRVEHVRRLSEPDHDLSRVGAPPVVPRVDHLLELPVPIAISRAERWDQLRKLAALPEFFAEVVALVGLRQLQVRLALLLPDDRGCELGEPEPVVLRERRDELRVARRPRRLLLRR
jgi:hypothetical protein